jgi:hypothetical protein
VGKHDILAVLTLIPSMKHRQAEKNRLIVLVIILLLGIGGLVLYLSPFGQFTRAQVASGPASSSLSELPQVKVQGTVVDLTGQSSVIIKTKSGYRYSIETNQGKITNKNGRVLTYKNLQDFLKVSEHPVVNVTGYLAPINGEPFRMTNQTMKFVKAVPTPTPTPRPTPVRRPTATPHPSPTPRPTATIRPTTYK